MPDISLCANSNTCPLNSTCYRATESRTKPSELRQAWMSFTYIEHDRYTSCAWYLPVEREEVTT